MNCRVKPGNADEMVHPVGLDRAIQNVETLTLDRKMV